MFVILYKSNNKFGKLHYISNVKFLVMRKILFLLLFFPLCIHSQYTVSYSSDVRSLQMKVNDIWDKLPIITLGSDDEICFSFDEMSHTYHRYIYRIIHCNADWSQSELFTSDYLNGFNEQTIEDWQNSEGTTMQYTHYEFCLPNENVSFKASGNYLVQIIDDDSDSDMPVATFSFAVIERKVGVEASVTSDTEIDLNKTHQQVSFTIHHGGYNIVSPASDVKVCVVQNRRPDNAVTDLQPTYITAGKLEYVYKRELIFDAGNEFRRFEITDPYSPGMGVDKVYYDGEVYNVELYPDRPSITRNNHRDENGRFYINTLQGYNVDVEADYAFVHYRLNTPYRSGGNYYLAGDYWGNRFSDANILLYDNAEGAYFTSQLMKFGVYNYQYVWLPDEADEAFTEPAEGDFYETENEYLILVYHREFGARYDRLVGQGSVVSQQD